MDKPLTDAEVALLQEWTADLSKRANPRDRQCEKLIARLFEQATSRIDELTKENLWLAERIQVTPALVEERLQYKRAKSGN